MIPYRVYFSIIGIVSIWSFVDRYIVSIMSFDYRYPIDMIFRPSKSYRFDISLFDISYPFAFSFIDIAPISFLLIDIVSTWFFVYRHIVSIGYLVLSTHRTYQFDVLSTSCRFDFSFIDISYPIDVSFISIDFIFRFSTHFTMYKKWSFFFFLEYKLFSSGRGSFSRSRQRGSQRARLYTTVQVWAPAGPRGACFGRSNSRNLASNHGVAFRPARANQAYANPNFFFFFILHFSLCCCFFEVGSHQGATAALEAFLYVTAAGTSNSLQNRGAIQLI